MARSRCHRAVLGADAGLQRRHRQADLVSVLELRSRVQPSPSPLVIPRCTFITPAPGATARVSNIIPNASGRTALV
jgi:hypothetical protein